jgi:hypothetical protein
LADYTLQELYLIGTLDVDIIFCLDMGARGSGFYPLRLVSER